MAPPDSSTQMAWKDLDHTVSKAAHGTPTDNLQPDLHSSLDRPTPTQGKKKKKTEK
jgi:hypothetical protein